MKAKFILVAAIVLLFFPVRGIPGSITYYNADGLEISAEAYQEESRKNVARYHAAVKHQARMISVNYNTRLTTIKISEIRN